ncbi:DUF7683 domain-containing protein [Sulfurospirillum diekertiae]|uniref:DUF7683 domain-containing protein n=1 Tax=Sulfurospirillum diekertiae TaxID=1854492 RepID=UPI0010FD1CBF|nr:hypothetical protein [Sulfurospirillum diekertiae]
MAYESLACECGYGDKRGCLNGFFDRISWKVFTCKGNKDRTMIHNMVFVIEYYDKENDTFIKNELISLCTIKDVKNILMEVYNDEKHIGISVNDEYLAGSYPITEKVKEKIYLKFGMDVDIEHYDCFLSQEYKSALTKNNNI